MLLVTPIGGHTATLGEARVRSFLNQPLDAEIDLFGIQEGTHQDLRLRIANQSDFDRLGIQYTALLGDLTFDVVRVDGRWIVRVRSNKPVREPFLDFPLLLSWRDGQMIKQFTLLLDPPRSIRPATRTSAAQSGTAGAPRTRGESRPVVSADNYGPVRRGETLWPIAQRLKPAGTTTQQMAMALLRNNPDAFIDNNINQLLEGAVLAIPPLSVIQELDAGSARAQFNAAVKQPNVRVAATATPQTVAPPRAAADAMPQTPDATPAAPTQPPAPGEDKEAQLRIVADDERDQPEPGSDADLKKKLLVTMEEIESNRLTTSAIESRLAKLENELERMQQLLDLKDAQIEALQSEVSTRNDIQTAAQQAEPTLPPAELPGTEAPEPSPLPADVAQQPLPTATIEAPAVRTTAQAPVGDKRSSVAQWYREYLWLIWAALALIGIAALMLMFRRPNANPDDVPMSEMAHVTAPGGAATVLSTPVPATAEEAIDARAIEADLRTVADAHLPDDESLEEIELPDIDIENLADIDVEYEAEDEITDSLLAEMLDDNKVLAQRPSPTTEGADFDDEDIASWIRELGNENDAAHAASDHEARGQDQDDIPSILTELDDQLTTQPSAGFGDASTVQLEPIELPDEDDTFTMSLDLARAYLEIGDQEGARDMLQQALHGARDPDHRRQIEELLQQIG